MSPKNLFWLICVCNFIPKNFSFNCNKERRCKTARVHGLRTSDCYRLDLKELPKCLPSNIEVVELSYNRIRKVSSQDLQRYPDIAHLYLMDNLIVNLEDETFKDMRKLETLDLSVNALAKIPATIFQLPSLKTLYLSQNMNINVAESIEEARPISHSSLTKLDISYITEEGATTDFPNFGELSMLAFLNISGDQFNYISTRHFAGLCNLQVLASANVTAEFENDCDCWKINHWLAARNVVFTSFLCPNIKKDCLNETIDEEDLKVFQKCKDNFQTIERVILLTKIGQWVGIIIGIILSVAAVIGYKMWSDSRKHKRASAAALAKASRKRDHVQLLNNQTKV